VPCREEARGGCQASVSEGVDAANGSYVIRAVHVSVPRTSGSHQQARTVPTSCGWPAPPGPCRP